MSTLKSILYVEDDPDIQAIGKLALSSIGDFEVMACSSGQAAIQAVIARPHQFQLMLLDVMMPQMDGPSTLHAIRQLPGGSAIPVIFCTAKVQRTEIDSYLALGAIGVIDKPFDAMELPVKIAQLWEKSGK